MLNCVFRLCGYLASCPVDIQSMLVLIGLDETLIIIIRDIHAKPSLQILINHDAFPKFLAYIEIAFCAVLQLLFYHTRSDRATLINQRWLIFHTPVTNYFFCGNSKTEVLVPSIAQFLFIFWIPFDVWLICQAEVTPITTSCQDWSHYLLLLTEIRLRAT